MLRRGEADLIAQIRQVLDANQFEQAFSAGTRLSQREAVAVIRDQQRGRARSVRPHGAGAG
jgi:hypothetical protein